MIAAGCSQSIRFHPTLKVTLTPTITLGVTLTLVLATPKNEGSVLYQKQEMAYGYAQISRSTEIQNYIIIELFYSWLST